MRARNDALAEFEGQWVNSEGLRHWARARRNVDGFRQQISRLSGKR